MRYYADLLSQDLVSWTQLNKSTRLNEEGTSEMQYTEHHQTKFTKFLSFSQRMIIRIVS
jgi:hypothetical protein